MTRMTQASIDDLLQAQTRSAQTGWQYFRHKWPETSAHQCRRRSRSKVSINRRRVAEISIVTVNGNFWTTRREWMVHVGPRHLVLGQEHPLEAGRCEEEAGKLERQGWHCGFSPVKRNLFLKTKSESSLATSAGTFVAAPRHWRMEWAWPARSWQSIELQAYQGRLTMAWVPIMGGLTVFSVYLYHTEEWTERNQQLLEALGLEIQRCPGLWIVAGDFNIDRNIFGQHATPARLPGVLVKPAAPTFRHGASVRCFDHFVVHGAMARQILEVCVLEDSGISPHHRSR